MILVSTPYTKDQKTVEKNSLPLVSNEDGISETGRTSAGKPRKQRQKVRSRSLIEVASLAGLRLPAISRPKFVDKLITGASSLTIVSSFRTKGYKRQLSLELPKSSYCQDFPSVDSSLKNDTILENIHESGHLRDYVQFCYSCGLQILNDNGKQVLSESHESEVTCSACKEKDDGQLCAGTLNSRACGVVEPNSVDGSSNPVDFNLEFVSSERQSVSCCSDLVSCKAESPDCSPEHNNSKPQATECPPQTLSSEPKHVHFQLQSSNCRSTSVDCVSNLVDCNSGSVDCVTSLVDCNSGSVDCVTNLVDCHSESVEQNCVLNIVGCDSYTLLSNEESLHTRSASFYNQSEILTYRSDTADHRSDTADHRSDTADHRSDTADHRSDTADHRSDTADNRSVNTDSRSKSLNESSLPEESSGHQDCLPENRKAGCEFVFCASESELGNVIVSSSSSLENRSQNECEPEAIESWSEQTNERFSNEVCTCVDADGRFVNQGNNVDNFLQTVDTCILQCEDVNQEARNPGFIKSCTQYSLYNTEGLHDTDPVNESLKSLCADSRQDTQNTSSVFSPGYVRRQCAAFSRSSHLLDVSAGGADQNGQTKKEQISLLTSSVKSAHTRSQGCPLDVTKQWQKNYYSLAWDSQFHQKVMAKGFVKALAEQINHKGSLTNTTEEEQHEIGSEDGEMSKSLVHSLIQAAEDQQLKESGSVCIAKKPHFSSTSSVSNNGSHSETVDAANAQQAPKELTMKNSELQQISGTKKPASHQGNETEPVFQSAQSSSHSPCAKLHGNKHVTTAKPAPKFSPNDTVFIPRSPTRPHQSFSRHKPDVDYTSKPKTHKMSAADTELNNSENSSPLSSTSHSPPSRKAAELSSMSSPSSVSSHPTVPCASDKSNSASENIKGNTSRPSYNTQCSSHSHIKSDQVSLSSEAKENADQYSDYDNAPPLNAAELFDSSWSDSDSLDEFNDEDGDDDNDRNLTALNLLTDAHSKTKTPGRLKGRDEDKRFRIAEELLQTERAYVARLHLLHQVFFFRLDNENRQQPFLPADTLQHMFSNTKSIFHFHHDFVLPQLEGRMANWKKDSRIGDLMKKNAPFLKMYTEYIRNFDKAMKLINLWLEKSARFSEIIQDVQKLPECGNLSLQHHMLGPIQRVPRYELLLKDYVKHLPEDSPDMSDSKEALDLVTKAACHSNEAMKKIETFHKLLDIYQSLRGVPVDFISPTREFVTQGPVIKIAARSGERQLRQIFLFNDLVLVCSQHNLLGTYNVRSFLEVESMEIRHGTNMHIPNSFLLHSKQKAVELLDENTNGECFGWEEKIQTVIGRHRERKKSIRHEEPREFTSDTNVPESCLGKTAPVWIQDDAATMCMLCMLPFNVVRRRHHCRACGKLICKTCCKKAPLEYMKGKVDRVCTACYNVIVNKQKMSASDSSTGETSPKKKGILHVKASEPALISGYMHCSEDGGHSWQHLWITAHKDFVLYSFKAHQDVSAISSLPLPGHEVTQIWDIESKPYVFCLSHKMKRVSMFQTDNDKHLKRWMFILEKLVHAELPEDSSRLSSQSNSSNSSSASDSGTNNDYNPSSTGSSSQADSGQPCSNSSSLSALAVDDGNPDNADGISQYDNVDGVVTE